MSILYKRLLTSNTSPLKKILTLLRRLSFRDALVYKGYEPLWLRISKLSLASGRTTYSLQPKNYEHPLELRINSSDHSLFRAIFIDEEYAVFTHVEDIKLIIDCGANVGYSSIYFLNRFPNAQVSAVEPDDRNFEMLQHNLRPYGSRVSLYHAGIWSHATGLIVCQGLYRDGAEWSTQVRECQAGETQDVNATDIDTLLAESNRDVIDLLKIDIERSEIILFSRNFQRWLPKVRNIVIELHDEECEQIFFQAMSSYTYDLTRTPELTICKNIQKLAED